MAEELSFRYRKDSDSDLDSDSDSEIEAAPKGKTTKASIRVLVDPVGPFKNIPGPVPRHDKVRVRRPDGTAKIIENDNAFPDGIWLGLLGGRPKAKAVVRDAGKNSAVRSDGYRVGSVDQELVTSVKLMDMKDEFLKKKPYYALQP